MIPNHTLKAILDTTPLQIQDRLVLNPLTLYRFALLEHIGFISEHPTGDSAIIGAYISTLSNDDVKKYGWYNIQELKTDANRWLKKNVDDVETLCILISKQIEDVAYIAPDNDDSETKIDNSTNGWMAQIIYIAINSLNLNYYDVLHMPLTSLILLVRQHIYNEKNGETMTLSDKELIDKLGEKV